MNKEYPIIRILNGCEATAKIFLHLLGIKDPRISTMGDIKFQKKIILTGTEETLLFEVSLQKNFGNKLFILEAVARSEDEVFLTIKNIIGSAFI